MMDRTEDKDIVQGKSQDRNRSRAVAGTRTLRFVLIFQIDVAIKKYHIFYHIFLS